MKTSPMQARYNGNIALNRLKRLLKQNFTPNDFEMFLSYSDNKKPLSELKAKKDIQNMLRRVKRHCDFFHSELKYIWIMEKEPDSGKIHFHLFIKKAEGISQAYLSTVWNKGGYMLRQYNKDSLKTLAELAQGERLTYRRWNSTRNFPDVDINDDYDLLNAKELKRIETALKKKYNEKDVEFILTYSTPENKHTNAQAKYALTAVRNRYNRFCKAHKVKSVYSRLKVKEAESGKEYFRIFFKGVPNKAHADFKFKWDLGDCTVKQFNPEILHLEADAGLIYKSFTYSRDFETE